jgi:phosphate transport system substrate-binding protein
MFSLARCFPGKRIHLSLILRVSLRVRLARLRLRFVRHQSRINAGVRRTLIAAAVALSGCSSQLLPVATPTVPTTTLRLYATTAALPLLQDLTTAYAQVNPALRIEIASGSFETILARVLRGEAPYFLTNHLPPDAEARGLWAAPIGQDGIAVIVHPDNPVQDLTAAQLRDVFQGRAQTWRDLGGTDEEVIVFSREDGSGTRTEFERLVMGQRLTTRAAQIAPSSVAMRTSIARTLGGIGYLSVGHLDESVRAVPIDGVLPTLDNIAANAYPLRATLFVVGQREPRSDFRAFIAWVQSPAGQAVVASRYAPMN